MQALIELLAGFIALLLTAALSQFGVEIHRPSQTQPEVHRVIDCGPPPAAVSVVDRPDADC